MRRPCAAGCFGAAPADRRNARANSLSTCGCPISPRRVNRALADATIRKKAQAAGLQPRGGTPAEFAAFVDAESRKWAEVIRSAKITVE